METDISLPVLLLVLSFYCRDSNCITNIRVNPESPVVHGLASCTQKLIRNNFNKGKIIAITSAPDDNDLNGAITYKILADLTEDLKHAVALSCLSQKPAYYIIVATKPLDFRLIVEAEKSCPYWSSTAKFLIIGADMNADLMEYFRIAWINKLYNTAIMFYNHSLSDVTVLTWNPVALCNFDYKPFENVHTRKCFDGALYSENIYKLFSGCSLKVGVNEYPPFSRRISPASYSTDIRFDDIDQYYGVEIDLLKYVCQKLNITSQIITTSDIPVIDIDKETLIDMLNKNKLDLVIGGITMKYIETNNFDFTYPHYHDEIHAFTKKRSDENIIKELLNLSDRNVVVCYLSIFIMSFLLYLGMLHFSGILRNTTNIAGGCMSALAINMGQPAILPSRVRGFCTMVIMLWIWMSFYARTVYQTALIKHIYEENSQHNLNTVQDICENNMTIIVPDIKSVRLLYSNRSDSNTSCMFHKDDFVECADLYDCLKYVLRQPNFATFVSVNFYNSEKWNVLAEKDFENEEFHYINELILATPLSFQFRQGNPLLRAFSSSGIRFVETGLLQYCLQKIHNNDLLKRSQFRRSKHKLHNHSYKKLTMSQVLQFFYIHLGGCLLSIICVMIEILYYYITVVLKFILNRSRI